MQIGELAAATSLSRDTLRFYEKRGLLLARELARPGFGCPVLEKRAVA
jgi:DNA-binding transcriptional MerR regulator